VNFEKLKLYYITGLMIIHIFENYRFFFPLQAFQKCLIAISILKYDFFLTEIKNKNSILLYNTDNNIILI